MDMRDDIIVVKQYKRIIEDESNFIDYQTESEDLDKRIEEFTKWEQKVEDLAKEYDFDDIENDFDDFKNNKAEALSVHIKELRAELKNLSFKSLAVEKLYVLQWCIDALILLLGPK